MKLYYLMIIIIMFFSFLGAEEVDSVKTGSTDEVEEAIAQETDDIEEGEDVFLDADGDGIADDRTFRERMQNWRRTRSMSDKIRSTGSGQDNSPENEKFGKKAKKGGQGSGNGNDNGNGNG
ncbi:hypothetical protein ACFLYK_03405 [Candidatus Cloacimonadota bacterium]